jgi:glutathione S-transferase
VPVLVDGELALCQSGSILEHLAARLGKFAGATVQDKARAREWLFWEFDKLSPHIYRARAVKRGFFKFDDAIMALGRTQGEAALATLESQLGKTPFLTGGSPTIADVAVYGVVAYAEEAGFALAQWPNVEAWKARFEQLPGVKHPYDLLPQQDAA